MKQTKKAVILARVSTSQQDYERQIGELTDEARKEGYEEVVTIADKESAIKLKEAERRGLNELKDVCADGSVGLVLVWEISRLARRQAVLYSVRDFLVERGIQLVVKTPYIKLLDSAGKITESANIVFSLFGALAESEMSLKKERMSSGKERRKMAGYYIGGFIPFGYKIADDNKIVPDENDAPIAREVFARYAKGESFSSIAKTMWRTGMLQHKYASEASARGAINKMIGMPQYIGEAPDGRGCRCEDAIIDRELWNKCNERREREAGKRPAYETGRPNMAKRIVYYEGRALTACWSRGRYQMQHEGKSLILTMGYVDGMLWRLTLDNWKPADKGKAKRELASKYRDLNRELRTLVKEGDKLEAKYDRIEERIVDGRMDESRGDKMLAQVKDEAKANKEAQAKCSARIEACTRELAAVANDDFRPQDVEDYAERCEIVHKTIKRIEVERTGMGRGIGRVELVDGRRFDVSMIFSPSRHEWEYVK